MDYIDFVTMIEFEKILEELAGETNKNDSETYTRAE